MNWPRIWDADKRIDCDILSALRSYHAASERGHLVSNISSKCIVLKTGTSMVCWRWLLTIFICLPPEKYQSEGVEKAWYLASWSTSKTYIPIIRAPFPLRSVEVSTNTFFLRSAVFHEYYTLVPTSLHISSYVTGAGSRLLKSGKSLNNLFFLTSFQCWSHYAQASSSLGEKEATSKKVTWEPKIHALAEWQTAPTSSTRATASSFPSSSYGHATSVSRFSSTTNLNLVATMLEWSSLSISHRSHLIISSQAPELIKILHRSNIQKCRQYCMSWIDVRFAGRSE